MVPALRQELPGRAAVKLGGWDFTVTSPILPARTMLPGKVCKWRMCVRMRGVV